MNIAISLIQGAETIETFAPILAKTRIKSMPLINALKYHFISGAAASNAYDAYGISQQGFGRGVNAMNKAYRKIESSKELS